MNRFLTLPALALAAYASALTGCGGHEVTVASDVAAVGSSGSAGANSAGANSVAGVSSAEASSAGASSVAGASSAAGSPSGGGGALNDNPGGPEVPADGSADSSDANPGGPAQSSSPCGSTCSSITQYCANLTGYNDYQCYPMPTPCRSLPTCSCLQLNDPSLTAGICDETPNGPSITIPWL